MAEFITFAPHDNASPPFSFPSSISEGLVTIDVVWNWAGERYYLRVKNDIGTTLLFTPLIGSPMGYDINLIRNISASKLVYRAPTNTFELTA